MLKLDQQHHTHQAPEFRKDVTPFHPYIRGLEEMSNESLQRGRQG